MLCCHTSGMPVRLPKDNTKLKLFSLAALLYPPCMPVTSPDGGIKIGINKYHYKPNTHAQNTNYITYNILSNFHSNHLHKVRNIHCSGVGRNLILGGSVKM